MFKWLKKKKASDHGRMLPPSAPDKILVFESNELQQKLLVDLFEAHGYETRQTGEALDVIGLTREFKPHLIVMAIYLTDVSGTDVLKRIKRDEALKGIPAIALPVSTLKENQEQLLNAGFKAVIHQPITINLLLEATRKILANEVVRSYYGPAESADVSEPSEHPNVETTSVDNAEILEKKPYVGWRSQIVHKGWNLKFPELIENQVPITDSSDPEEQIFILRQNSKLDELKLETARNAEVWKENKIESLLAELIDIMKERAGVSHDTVEPRKILSFYHILAGLAAKETEKSAKNFKSATEVMESLVEDFPEILTDPKEADFRDDFFNSYAALFRAGPPGKTAIEERIKSLVSEMALADGITRDYTRSAHNIWTEARIQNAARLKMEGLSVDEVALGMGGLQRNNVFAMMYHQDDFREKPLFFGR